MNVDQITRIITTSLSIENNIAFSQYIALIRKALSPTHGFNIPVQLPQEVTDRLGDNKPVLRLEPLDHVLAEYHLAAALGELPERLESIQQLYMNNVRWLTGNDAQDAQKAEIEALLNVKHDGEIKKPKQFEYMAKQGGTQNKRVDLYKAEADTGDADEQVPENKPAKRGPKKKLDAKAKAEMAAAVSAAKRKTAVWQEPLHSELYAKWIELGLPRAPTFKKHCESIGVMDPVTVLVNTFTDRYLAERLAAITA